MRYLLVLAGLFSGIICFGQIQHLTVGINGLTCSQCSRSVELQLRKLSFIKDVNMNLQQTEGTLSLVQSNTAIPFEKDEEFSKVLIDQKMFGIVDETVPLEAIPDPNNPEDPLMELNPVTGAMEIKYYPRPIVYITSQDIARYHVKEDWFFDKERSVLDVRIIAISPVVLDLSSNTYRELFWLYFPECRFVFNNYYTYNTKNDSQWMSFDDYFWKRQFASTIYKQSDVFDRTIEQYRYGIDALIESQKITEDIRTFENDLWHF